MKTKFKYYYKPSEKRQKEFDDKCVFILDTNVLLDLLRLDKDLTEKALKCFSENKERIRIPYYVGIEYHKDFRKVVIDQSRSFKETAKKINAQTFINNIFSALSSIRFSEARKNKIKEAFAAPTQLVIDEINSLVNYFTELSEKTDLQEKIADALDGMIFDELTAEQIAGYEKEGEERYNQQIPPGYKDKNKRTNKYGDLIIWREILEYAKEHQVDICFVSRDLKEDWQELHEGKVLCPRYELQREFQLIAPKCYFKTMTLDRMLEMLNDGFTSEEIMDVKALEEEILTKISSKDESDEELEEENEIIAGESTEALKGANKNDMVNVSKAK